MNDYSNKLKTTAIFALVVIDWCLLFLLYNAWMDKRNLESEVAEQQRIINTYKRIEETGKNGG